jgi:DNA-binding response OmpR family regulator
MTGGSILIVEDDRTFGEVTRSALETSGYKTRIAGTVSEGLAMAADEVPALLVLDIELPDGNGFSFLEAVRQTYSGQHVPAIVVSSKPVTRAELRDHKVERFIPKPFDMADLMDYVGEVLRR